MSAILAILRANPLAFGLAAAMLLSASAFAVQTWRLGNAQEHIGEIRAQVDECTRANESNQDTIAALRTAQAENEAERRRILEGQRKAAQRARELQQELNQRGSDDIIQIERTPGDCADTDAPRPIVLRVTARGGNGDGAGRGGEGAAGSR